MINKTFRLIKLNSSSISDPLINRYASLGYFHYRYILELDPSNSSQNIVKDIGTRGTSNNYIKKGYYIEIAVADFTKRRKTCFLFKSIKSYLEIRISDLLEVLNEMLNPLKINKDDCFIKFDMYSIVD